MTGGAGGFIDIDEEGAGKGSLGSTFFEVPNDQLSLGVVIDDKNVPLPNTLKGLVSVCVLVGVGGGRTGTGVAMGAGTGTEAAADNSAPRVGAGCAISSMTSAFTTVPSYIRHSK